MTTTGAGAGATTTGGAAGIGVGVCKLEGNRDGGGTSPGGGSGTGNGSTFMLMRGLDIAGTRSGGVVTVFASGAATNELAETNVAGESNIGGNGGNSRVSSSTSGSFHATCTIGTPIGGNDVTSGCQGLLRVSSIMTGPTVGRSGLIRLLLIPSDGVFAFDCGGMLPAGRPAFVNGVAAEIATGV